MLSIDKKKCSNIADVLSILDKIPESNELFVKDDSDFLSMVFSYPHSCYIYYISGMPIATGYMWFPPSGNAFNIMEKSQLKSFSNDLSFQMETFAVIPQYRGHGLQKEMIGLLEIDAYEMGGKYSFTSISPLNTYSINNFNDSGYTIVCENKKLYNDVIRTIFVKSLFNLPGVYEDSSCERGGI
jgi:ribosomal protein S18 acetylase RimI-like enzyme